jgi:L-fuconolactonase
MTVVDAHTHVFSAASARFPRDVHELFPAELEATADELLAEMDAIGIDRAVLVPLSPHDEYVRDCLARFPGRFAAIGVAAPGPPDVDAYRRRREASGLQGLRLFALGDALPLLAELAAQGDKLWFYGGQEQTALLERALERLPELTVVLNHLGYWPTAFRADEHGRIRFEGRYTPENLAAVTRLARFPRVFVLVTGMYAFAAEPPPYADLRPVAAGLLDAFGSERLLLGSDFPWIRTEPGYRETLAAAEHLLGGLDDAAGARIRGANALELFAWS